MTQHDPNPHDPNAHDPNPHDPNPHDPNPHDPSKHDPAVALQFYATLMGGRLEQGPPPADSVLGWLLAHPDATPDDLGAEWRRRGVLPAEDEGWAWENPRFRRPHDERED